MKTRGIADFYLPHRIAYHIKIILASFTVAFLFNLLREGRIWLDDTPDIIILMFVELEMFVWLGMKFFSYKTPETMQAFLRKAIKRLILFYLLAFFLSAVFFIVFVFIIHLIRGLDHQNLIQNILKYETKGFLVGISTGYLIGTVIFFFTQWVEALKREQKLREEKLIFQYETLKNQVNPHFLFNSLNTLSSLVYKDPELSDEFIRKLSSIYRYILENRDHELVGLETEIEFMNQYFSLQKVRDNGKIELTIDAQNPGRYKILPISLQMLMENALKHNASTRENPLKMRIHLDDKNGFIIFSNNLQPKRQIEVSSKIGLKNLGERIRLTMQKEIEINESENEFVVKIPVK